jgi:hypothetical protein
MVIFIKESGKVARHTVKEFSLTRRIRPFTKVNGKWTNSMVKVLKLGMTANVSIKDSSLKERKLAGPVMSKMEMFTKVISLMESSMARASITLSTLERLTKASLSITKSMEKER